jgi:hypothetical protein
VRLAQVQGGQPQPLGLAELVRAGGGVDIRVREVRRRLAVRGDDAQPPVAVQRVLAGRRVEHGHFGYVEIPRHPRTSPGPPAPALARSGALCHLAYVNVPERSDGSSLRRVMQEVLVEFEPGAELEPAESATGARVVQRMPPRLAIVAADADATQALERRPEVRAVFAGDVPPEALARLDEPERTFAAAWNARRAPNGRRGEGLPWDAPGFEAP